MLLYRMGWLSVNVPLKNINYKITITNFIQKNERLFLTRQPKQALPNLIY
jgi:hypothetical protein